mmetsp:Transcript_23674/g.55871  ORF Transcript_23674/g.55871 Transcript_23674/m.55871 type:complete len:987 (-) Transcript_23674:1196-4156(-)
MSRLQRRRSSATKDAVVDAHDTNQNGNAADEPNKEPGALHELDQLDLDLEDLPDNVVEDHGEDAAALDDIDQFLKEKQVDKLEPTEPPKKKKASKNKKKKEPAKTTKKKKAPIKRDPKSQKELEKLLEGAREDARRELEDEKEEIFRRVPRNIQGMWGQVGFAKWNKSYLPVLNLSPYDVPPGPVRQMWMEMFEKMRENGRPLEKMSYLVYWYGEESPQSYYSITANSNFVKYDDAPAKMKDFAKTAEKKKLDGAKKLSSDDQQRLRGMKQLQEDLKKPFDERKRGDLSFKEGYELLTFSDVDELVDENGDPHDGDDEEDEVEQTAEVTNQKKKSAKTKKKSTAPKKKAVAKERVDEADSAHDDGPSSEEAEEEEYVDEESSNARAKTKKKSAVGKGKKSTGRKTAVSKPQHKQATESRAEPSPTKVASRKRNRSMVGVVAEGGDAADAIEEAPAPEKKRKVVRQGEYTTNLPKSGRKKGTVKDEVETSRDDSKEKVKKGGRGKRQTKSKRATAGDDEDAEMVQVEAEGEERKEVKNPRKKRRKIESGADGEKGRHDIPKQSKSKRRTKTTMFDDDIEMEEESPMEVATRLFRENEETFEPALREWQKLIVDGETKRLTVLFVEFKTKLEQTATNISAPFLEKYQVYNYLKETKAMLKGQTEKLELFKQLKKTIRELYGASKNNTPDGFTVEPRFADLTELTKTNSETNGRSEADTSNFESQDTVLDLIELQEAEPHRNGSHGSTKKQEATTDDSRGGVQEKLNGRPSEKDQRDETTLMRESETQTDGAALTKVPRKTPTKRDSADVAIDKPKIGKKPVKRSLSKGFSLSSFSKQSSKAAASTATADVSTDNISSKKKQTPEWLSKPGSLKPPTDPDRLLGLEYLRQMALQFPCQKVKVDSMALAVEDALSRWAKLEGDTNDRKKLEAYWDRLHAVVAGVCGEAEPGPLMHLIVSGEIQTAADLVSLSEEILCNSFKGKHVALGKK